MGKVVEIPADMTARDLCQLLVYKSHCVDDNSWALVEHHPLLGLGKGQSPAGPTHTVHIQTKTDTHTHEQTLTYCTYTETHGFLGGLIHAIQSLTDTGAFTYMHACVHTRADRQFKCIFSRRHVFKHECMHILYSICCCTSAVLCRAGVISGKTEINIEHTYWAAFHLQICRLNVLIRLCVNRRWWK